MPILKNAQKALRASKRKATINQRVKSMLKTALDKVIKSPSEENLQLAFSKIDKAKKRNLIAKNKASRLKAKVSKTSKSAGVKLTSKTASKKKVASKPANTQVSKKTTASKKAK